MIRIGIFGYGNLGRGIEAAIRKNEDMQLVAVFTRRNPETLKIRTSDVSIVHSSEVINWKDKIDVMVLCGGSATDLPEQTPQLAEIFNVVDSFDTHAKIPEHFNKVDVQAKKGKKTALISAGWDPGMFSLNRLYAECVLPDGNDYTFWGKGVSQGHSDAIRRIEGVKDAKQYTIPKQEALSLVREGANPELTTRDKHLRECFVVAYDNADKSRIEFEIKTMPNYFADYDTVVHFISQDEFERDHSAIPHGGFVIRSGKTGFHNENNHIIEYSLKLDSNPEFTASVITAYVRAVYRLNNENSFGCKTVFDIAPSYLSIKSADELRATLL